MNENIVIPKMTKVEALLLSVIHVMFRVIIHRKNQLLLASVLEFSLLIGSTMLVCFLNKHETALTQKAYFGDYNMLILGVFKLGLTCNSIRSSATCSLKC